MSIVNSIIYRMKNLFPNDGIKIPRYGRYKRSGNQGIDIAIECFTGYDKLNIYYITVLSKLIKEENINNVFLLYKNSKDKYLWQNRLLKRYLSAEEVVLKTDSDDSKVIIDIIKNNKSVLDINLNEFNVGQDIYFSKLRDKKIGQYNLDPSLYKKEISDFVSRSQAMKEFLDNNTIDCLLISDIAYTSFLPIFSTSVGEKINTLVSFPYGTTGKIGGRNYLDASDYNNVVRRFPFSFTEKTWHDAKKVNEAVINKFVQDRVSGRTDLFDGGYQKGKQKGVQTLNLKVNKFTALIACHLVWDNPGYESLFNDYIDWLTQTLISAKKRSDINWIVKSHPSEKHLGTNEKIINIANNLFSGDIPENICLIEPDADVNTFQLIEEVDLVVTCRGTITFEAASLGKKVVTAGKGPHTGLGIAEEFQSKDEYLEYLSSETDFSFINIDLAKRAMYTYMDMKAVESSLLKTCFEDPNALETVFGNGLSDEATALVHQLILGSESKDIVSC